MFRGWGSGDEVFTCSMAERLMHGMAFDVETFLEPQNLSSDAQKELLKYAGVKN